MRMLQESIESANQVFKEDRKKCGFCIKKDEVTASLMFNGDPVFTWEIGYETWEDEATVYVTGFLACYMELRSF